MALLALLLAGWERLRGERPPWLAWSALTFGFALVSWVHGNWYLWLLPLAAFVAVREWRAAARIAAAFTVGTLVGALATGEPRAFLAQAVSHLFWALGSTDQTRLLAIEFQPGGASPALLVAVALLLLWRRGGTGGNRRAPGADPAFLVAATSAILALAVARFWTDWGLPALLVWMTRQLEGAWSDWASNAARRLLALGLAATVLVLAVTTNRNDRWSNLEGERHLRLDDPTLAGWLPEPGGILYSSSMGVFYDTFFENPHAPFRYVLGFEPGLMPPADLAIFRAIQRGERADATFLPWAAKLRPIDRLVVARQSGGQPQIGGLDWHSPFSGVWIGRLRR
jgi:hypothetical protein